LHEHSNSGSRSKLGLERDHKPEDEAEQEESTPRAADTPSTSTNTIGIISSTSKLSRRIDVYVKVPTLELLHTPLWPDQKPNVHDLRTPQTCKIVRFGMNGNGVVDIHHDMNMDNMDTEPPLSPTKSLPVKIGDQDERGKLFPAKCLN
jgi:hypothetical protein